MLIFVLQLVLSILGNIEFTRNKLARRFASRGVTCV